MIIAAVSDGAVWPASTRRRPSSASSIAWSSVRSVPIQVGNGAGNTPAGSGVCPAR